MEERQFQICPNCSTELKESDKFCPDCGQRNIDKKVKLRHLLNDFLGDYFTFDSKLFHSLFPLLFQPGIMTRQFLEGKRERFIPPLRMFIFLSFVLLLLLSLRINDVEDSRIFHIKTEAGDSANGSAKPNAMFIFNFKNGDTSVLARADSLSNIYPVEQVVDSIAPNESFMARLGLRQFIKLKQTKGRGFLSYIVGHGTFILMVISLSFTLVLYLFYFKHERLFISHLIVSFHFHSFLVVFLIILVALSWLFWNSAILFSLPAIGIVYLFFSLKNVYRQKINKTFFKLALITFFYMFFLLPAAVFGAMAIGFFMF